MIVLQLIINNLRRVLKMKRLLSLFLLVVVCFALIATGQSELEAAAGGRKFVRFGGSNPGGSWFTIVGGLSAFLSGKIGDLNVTPIATGGSVDNNRLARKGELDSWLTHSLTAHDNYNGVGLFEGEGSFKDYRMLSGVYENHHHFVTLAKSDIFKMADLKGKKVCVGSAGSGGAVNSENILRAIGLWDDVEPSNLTWSAAGQALSDGQVDVVGASSAPLPAIVTVEASREIRLLELTEEEFDQVLSKFPAYSRSMVPADAYKSLDKPSPCIAFQVYWAGHKNADPESVYKMLKTAFDSENKESIGKIHRHLKQLSASLEAMKSLGIPLHPGAVKFWKEQGLSIPSELIPPEM